MTKSIAFLFAASLLAVTACGQPEPSEPETSAELPALPGAEDDDAEAERPTSAPPTLSEEEKAEMDRACSTVSVEGMCNVAFGMTEEEAREAFPTELYGGVQENPSCYYLRPSATSYGRAFMVEGGTVQRVDVRDGSAKTLLGAGVGTPLDEVEAMYEDTQRTPNKYAPANDDLKADLGKGVYAVFEEGSDGKVRAFRVGLEPAVDFVEGCG